MDEITYYTYIMGSFRGVLYVGMTNDIEGRVIEHKSGCNKGFTKKYRCRRLLYFEEYESPMEAIVREKQIKKYRREKKERLIHNLNPDWNDLAEDWFDDLPTS